MDSVLNKVVFTSSEALNSILITGASSGIGLAAAELFAQNGFTVYAASRRCDESAQGLIINIRMDVCDEASVLRARDLIEARGGVGILLHSAGMGIAGAAEAPPEEAVRAQFEVNYFGVLRVNRIFLQILLRSILPTMTLSLRAKCLVGPCGGRARTSDPVRKILIMY